MSFYSILFDLYSILPCFLLFCRSEIKLHMVGTQLGSVSTPPQVYFHYVSLSQGSSIWVPWFRGYKDRLRQCVHPVSYEEGPYLPAGFQRFPSTGLLSPWRPKQSRWSFHLPKHLPNTNTAKWTEQIADEGILEKKLGGNRGPRENAYMAVSSWRYGIWLRGPAGGR